MSDLLDRHDFLLADLDGTLYRGPVAVPGAVEAVRGAADRGVRTVYVTNNASRAPGRRRRAPRRAGLPGHRSRRRHQLAGGGGACSPSSSPPGAAVLVVGTDALAAEVTGVGLTVTDQADEAVAVVQGHSPDTGWRHLAEATVALRAGARLGRLQPRPHPADRARSAARQRVDGRGAAHRDRPGAAGGGQARARAGERVGAAGRRAPPLVVGDRLDTDIEGGRAAGMPTLLVLTGVSDAAELLAAPPERRPDYIGADLGALTRDPADARARAAARLGRSTAGRAAGRSPAHGDPARRAARAVRRALGGRRRTGRSSERATGGAAEALRSARA